MSAIWSLSNPPFVSFVFYAAVLSLKMLAMGPITAFYRMKNGAFANPEDAKGAGQKGPKTDPDVERVRRAHQNDLENIVVFFVVASLFLFTNPSTFVAQMLFRVFTFCRILHTFFYLRGSSLRPLFYLVPFCINMYMSGCLIYKFL